MESKTKRRLGRGLEALLGPTTSDTEARSDASFRRIPLGVISPNPFQPRQAFDEGALNDLQQSMAASGLLQPVVVRSINGKFELIAGERRFRAAQRLEWNDIPAIVREVDDRTLLALALVENIQRDSLSPIDEARGYQRLIEEFGVSHADVGELVGRNRSTIANALRLLKLPDAVQELLHDGRLSTGHARALLQADDQLGVPLLAQRAVTEHLSVRELERIVRGNRIPRKRRSRKSNGADATDTEVRRVEDTLRRHLGTDVFVTKRSKHSGRLTVNYYSNDDLARILELVLGRPFEG